MYSIMLQFDVETKWCYLIDDKNKGSSYKTNLVQFINSNDQILELLLQNVGRAQIQKLTSGLDRNLFRKFEKKFVDQVRVLDDDGHLLEERVVSHLEVLDAFGTEVAGFVQLDGHRRQTERLQGQETLTRLGCVCKSTI